MRKFALAALTGALFLSACAVSDQSIAFQPSLPVILSKADVTVSDGTTFKLTTGLRPAGASYRADYPDRTILQTTDFHDAFEETDEGAHRIADDYILFVLAHQFHAQVAHFAELNQGVAMQRDCLTVGDGCRERIGNRSAPGLGITQLGLQYDRKTGRPIALLAYRDNDEPITATFSDWRSVDGRDIAYRVTLDDGVRSFDYRYTLIDGL